MNLEELQKKFNKRFKAKHTHRQEPIFIEPSLGSGVKQTIFVSLFEGSRNHWRSGKMNGEL